MGPASETRKLKRVVSRLLSHSRPAKDGWAGARAHVLWPAGPSSWHWGPLLPSARDSTRSVYGHPEKFVE